MEENFSKEESLKLINEMILKAKNSHYESGIGPLLWGSVIFICSMVSFIHHSGDSVPLFLILYGIPTLITAGIKAFKPMLYGGIVCWIAAIISVYTDIKIDLLLMALSALCAWFIPGIILRKRYLKLLQNKQSHGV